MGESILDDEIVSIIYGQKHFILNNSLLGILKEKF